VALERYVHNAVMLAPPEQRYVSGRPAKNSLVADGKSEFSYISCQEAGNSCCLVADWTMYLA